MIIKLNENKEIISYVETGEIDGGIKVDNIPSDFIEKYQPSFFILNGSMIEENPNFKEQDTIIIDNTVEQLKQELEQSKQDYADLTYQLMMAGVI
ncbi:DUF2977 domain-containing protein [Niallia sp. RD1]|uniref:DUF2977 domain-containing protein n=1 Tax=Niallia sp. RD1 TaxID=2962858 RepID=UPI0020C19118|nr:DUF2977 domain-containing protein [Niallia sp. RD1]UTI44442.1 DUF2977 domain-containing protein [Niallia sp. RD1]